MGDAGCVLGMAVIQIGMRTGSQGRAVDVSQGGLRAVVTVQALD